MSTSLYILNSPVIIDLKRHDGVWIRNKAFCVEEKVEFIPKMSMYGMSSESKVAMGHTFLSIFSPSKSSPLKSVWQNRFNLSTLDSQITGVDPFSFVHVYYYAWEEVPEVPTVILRI